MIITSSPISAMEGMTHQIGDGPERMETGRVCLDGGGGLTEERVNKKERMLLELSGTSRVSHF